MKKTNGFAVATTLLYLTLGALSGQAARDDLPTLFDEDTMFYIEIPSMPQIQEDWEENPFNELYQRDDVREFVDGLIENFKSDMNPTNEEDEFDDQDQAILDGLLTGQLAIGVSRMDFLSFFPNPMLSPEENAMRGRPVPNFWIVFDYEQDGLEELLIKDMEDDENEYIEYQGFYIILEEDFSVAFNDDVAAVCNSEEAAITFVDRFLGNDSRPTLADQEIFQNGFSRMYEDSEIFYFLDLSIIGEVAEDAANEYGEFSNAMVQNGQLAPSETILEALGLEAFQGFSGSINTDPADLRMKYFVHFEENEGFFGKFMDHYGNYLPDASFLSEEFMQASVSNFDISGMLHDLEETIVAISPMAGQMYLGQKSQMGQALSIDIDEALIDNFSGSLYLVSGETPNTAASDAGLGETMPGMDSIFDQGSTVIVGINDRLALEALVDSLLVSFGQSELIGKQDFQGVSYYSMNSELTGIGPSVFISDQHLLIEQTNPDFGKLVINSMQDSVNPIFQRRDVQDALNDLPPDPLAMTYSDAEQIIAMQSKLLRTLVNSFPSPPGEEEEDNPLANLEIPVIDGFEYFTLSTGYKEDEGLHQEVIMRPKSN